MQHIKKNDTEKAVQNGQLQKSIKEIHTKHLMRINNYTYCTLALKHIFKNLLEINSQSSHKLIGEIYSVVLTKDLKTVITIYEE